VAQDLRSRLALTVGTVLLLAACTQEVATPPPPAARPLRVVDTAAMPEQEVPAAVLAECHAPLRGGMDRITATVTLPGGETVQAFAELPDRLRVQSSHGTFLLLANTVHGIDGGAVANADADRTRALRELLDVAAFGPLHRATGCRRLGPDSFAIVSRAGEPTTTLTLRPQSLLPAAFASPAGSITVDEYLTTPSTWIARVLTTPHLGRCEVTLDQSAFEWAPEFFVPPGGTRPTAAERTRIPSPGSNAETRTTTPVEVAQPASSLLCVRDPGDWPGRVAAYRPLHAELQRQDQHIAGFPVFWQEGGTAWLGAPFRRRPEGQAFVVPDGWDLREVPAARWLVVHPEPGDLAAKLATGERLLREGLAQRGCVAVGPIQAQPWFHLHEGPPPDRKLASPTVRMAVRLQ
jgi:hypothetical protein